MRKTLGASIKKHAPAPRAAPHAPNPPITAEIVAKARVFPFKLLWVPKSQAAAVVINVWVPATVKPIRKSKKLASPFKTMNRLYRNIRGAASRMATAEVKHRSPIQSDKIPITMPPIIPPISKNTDKLAAS